MLLFGFIAGQPKKRILYNETSVYNWDALEPAIVLILLLYRGLSSFGGHKRVNNGLNISMATSTLVGFLDLVTQLSAMLLNSLPCLL